MRMRIIHLLETFRGLHTFFFPFPQTEYGVKLNENSFPYLPTQTGKKKEFEVSFPPRLDVLLPTYWQNGTIIFPLLS